MLFISGRLNTRVARENAAARKLRTLEAVTAGKREERNWEYDCPTLASTSGNTPPVQAPRPPPLLPCPCLSFN